MSEEGQEKKLNLMGEFRKYIRKNLEVLETICINTYNNALDLEESISDDYLSPKFTKTPKLEGEKNKRRIVLKKPSEKHEKSKATLELEEIIGVVSTATNKLFNLKGFEEPEIIAADPADGFANLAPKPGQYKIRTSQPIANAAYETAYQYALHVVTAKTRLRKTSEVVKAIADSVAETIYKSLPKYHDDKFDAKLEMNKALKLREACLSVAKRFSSTTPNEELEAMEVPRTYHSSNPAAWAAAAMFLTKKGGCGKKYGAGLYRLLIGAKGGYKLIGLKKPFAEYRQKSIGQ